MPTNDFIGFAAAGSANVMSQADYAAATEQMDGVQPGPASSKLANKIWRQGANMASALGDVIVEQGQNALDNGDIGALKTALETALLSLYGSAISLSSVNPSAVSVPTGTSVTSLTSFDLTKGLYIIQAEASFAENASGERQVGISVSATSSNMSRYSLMRSAASPTRETIVTLILLLNVSSDATYYFNVCQTSGSTLTVNSGINILKIK